MKFRKEEDFLGEVKIPSHAYYGVQTARAMESFSISGLWFPREFIRSQGIVKKAAAIANMKLGKLEKTIGNAIIQACDDVIEGKLDDQFPLDVFQAGAGTSQNMNVNEVIANRAIEILGGDKGDYSLIHPNDHVNMSQSTNDTFHVAMNITIFESLYNKLFPACERLIHVFSSKAKEFSKDIKTGRTHLMDAVPITLGQEFSGYAATLQENYRNLRISSNSLLELNFGGTAVGTGLNAPKEFSEIAIREINHMTGLDFKKADNFFKVTQNTLGAMRVSSGLREIALSLIKISNDIRLLASGPRTGIGEITLPEVQPGSSIMPGKINPVIAEMVNMVCFQVCGNDTAVSMAYQSAQLELNVFMPVIAHDILFSIHILSKAIDTLNEKCISGIQANSERCRELAEKSLSLVTILSPYIGYHKAAEIARRAYITGKTIKEVLVEDGVMNSEKAEKLLDPYSMV